MGLLRIPKQIELMGLDFGSMQDKVRAVEEVKAAHRALV